MKTLVIGAAGYVGSLLAEKLTGAVGTSQRLAFCSEFLDHVQPDVVVNCAGQTGRPNVDWCESHKIETYEANTIGAVNLGVQCLRRGIHLVHISSGCIFFGHKGEGGWFESDQPNPRTVYTRSKYAADIALEDLGAAVVRIRSPISATPHPRNLITKIRGYDQVVCSFPSVTWLDELPMVVRAIVERRSTGIFHAVNPGTICTSDLKRPDATTIDEETLRGMTACERSTAHVVDTRIGRELGVYMAYMPDILPDILRQYDLAIQDQKESA